MRYNIPLYDPKEDGLRIVTDLSRIVKKHEYAAICNGKSVLFETYAEAFQNVGSGHVCQTWAEGKNRAFGEPLKDDPTRYVVGTIKWDDRAQGYVLVYSGRGYNGTRPRPKHLMTFEEAIGETRRKDFTEAKKTALEPSRKPRMHKVYGIRLTDAKRNARTHHRARTMDFDS